MTQFLFLMLLKAKMIQIYHPLEGKSLKVAVFASLCTFVSHFAQGLGDKHSIFSGLGRN